jgi:hypothetical protein
MESEEEKMTSNKVAFSKQRTEQFAAPVTSVTSSDSPT